MFLALALTTLAQVPPPTEGVALVWSGGKTREAAEAELERWSTERDLLGDDVVLPEGFPQLRDSSELQGMTPGFHVVLLGVCEPSAAKGVRRFLKAVYPFSYEKPVRGAPLACPRWGGAADGWAGLDVERRDREERTWLVEPASLSLARGASVARVPVLRQTSFGGGISVVNVTRLLLVARDRQGRRLDVWSETGKSESGESATTAIRSGCDLSSIMEKNGIQVIESCEGLEANDCVKRWGRRWRVTFDGAAQRLVATQLPGSGTEGDAKHECPKRPR